MSESGCRTVVNSCEAGHLRAKGRRIGRFISQRSSNARKFAAQGLKRAGLKRATFREQAGFPLEFVGGDANMAKLLQRADGLACELKLRVAIGINVIWASG